jgi:hypothetical protein
MFPVYLFVFVYLLKEKKSLMSKEEKKSTGLVPVVQSNLPVSTQSKEVFQDLAKSSAFLGRLQLYSKGAAIMKNLIGSGEFGIPEGDDKITVLGPKLDAVVLVRRPKALDISDTSAIVQSFDPDSADFKRIAKQSAGKDSGCMYGVSFLIFERTSKRFLEYFAGTKTARGCCGDLFPFLPENHSADAEYLTPVTMSARLIEKGTFAWHAPVFVKCSTPIDMPSQERMAEEMTKFLDPDTNSQQGEAVSKEEAAATTGRKR